MKNNLDLIKNFKPMHSNYNRMKLLFDNAVSAIYDPNNADAVSKVGDLSNMNSLRYAQSKMRADKVGSQILSEMPRIRGEIVNLDKLKEFNKNSLGFHYYKFMSKYDFTPEERPIITYYTELELAYILQRYKEIHDFIHVLLGYDIYLVDELAVKAYEAMHLKLPSGAFSSTVGSLSLISTSDFLSYCSKYVPHVKYNADNNSFLLNIYFEKELERDINDLRKELNIIPLQEF